jgi:serine/threonine protein kinase
MNGGDAERLAATPLQTVQELVSRLVCFREMVRCVARLHFKNCFHRDLKPGNFLFENSPGQREVKLSDFGTIRFCDGSPTLAGEYRTPVGDLRYAAPELFSGVDIPQGWNRAADLYSLGCILFELITSRQLIEFTFGDANNALDFAAHLMARSAQDRLGIFHGFLEQHGHALPNVRTINPLIPKCVAGYLDDLLAELTAFDYRARRVELTSAVRVLDICRIVLTNEQRYQERLGRRRNAGRIP